MSEPLLAVRNLGITFRTDRGLVRAVNGIAFSVGARETVAIVGGSGSGKTTAALSILRLLPPSAKIASDSSIAFGQRDLLSLKRPALQAIRGREIGMVFQDAGSALDPLFPVGDQIAEVLRTHVPGLSSRAAWDEAVGMLAMVGVTPPAERARQYPHELSGGLKQRVMLAIALVLRPTLLIADEPTTALDMTVQAQIIELLADLRDRLGMAMLLITHDLGVAGELADRVVVMSKGEVVEDSPSALFFMAPRHPVSQGLLSAAQRSRAALSAYQQPVS